MLRFQELRLVTRSLARSPRTTILAVSTLALGIGASTSIFSVVHAVLLRSLPYPEPERIVQVWQVNDGGSNRGWFSDPNFSDLHERSGSFQALAQYDSSVVSVVGGAQATRVRAASVSRDFFEVLGVSPIVGRAFVPGELVVGAEPTALVSYGFWQSYLGGERDLSSLQMSFGGQVYRVIGVMPPELSFPPGASLWTPRELTPPLTSRTAHNWRAVGRLAEGVSLERAQLDVSAVARELRAQWGEDTWMIDAALVPLHEQIVGDARPALIVLLGAVGFLLLVACANVVNLLLARAASRQKELAVKAALGASRWQLARPFLLEALLLSLVGGGLGSIGAVWGVRALLAFEPGKLPRADEIGASAAMLVFTVGLSVATGLALGIVAAIRSTKGDLRGSLREGQRSQLGGASGPRMRGILVVSQVALTLVLLVGAGLLGKSLYRLLEVDPGFRIDSRVAMDLSHTPPVAEKDGNDLARLQDAILERVRSLPGVSRAGGVDLLPMAGGSRNGVFLVMQPGETIESFEDFGRLMKDPARVGEAEYRAASSGFFQAIGIPLLRGRLFDDRDHRDAPHVALISESLAERKWPGRDPLGSLIEFGNMDGDLRLLRVVGIVGDVRHGGLDSDALPTVYVNARQRPPSSFTVVMEAASAPATIAAAREVMRELAPELPPRFRTMDDVFRGSIADRRFNLLLLAVFGAAALALAAVGIYGIVSYGVSQRTREIGVRVALGARQSHVLELVVGQGSRPILVGIAVGVIGAMLLSRFLESLLFEVSRFDVVTFVGLAALLASIALAACYLPAREAARTDPMRALRSE